MLRTTSGTGRCLLNASHLSPTKAERKSVIGRSILVTLSELIGGPQPFAASAATRVTFWPPGRAQATS